MVSVGESLDVMTPAVAELDRVGAVHAEIVTGLDAFDALKDEWNSLLARAIAPRELQHDHAVIRLTMTAPAATFEPRFVVVRIAGEVRCIAPFYVQRTDVPLRLSVIKLASAGARVLRLCGDRVLLHRDQEPGTALHAVFDALGRMRTSFDLLWVYTQRLADPLWAFVKAPESRSSFKPIVTSALPDRLHGLRFEGTFDHYLTEVRSKPGFAGKTIRRFWRDNAGRCAIVRVSEPDQVETFLAGVDRVYNRSWQGLTYGKQTRNDRADVERLRAVAALGHLRSYLLTEDGEAIAFVVGFQYRGRYTYEETGFDPARSAVSPGSVLTHGVVEDLFRHDTPVELDFGFGDGAYKRTFGNCTEDVCSMYLVPFGRWRVILGMQQALNGADVIARRMITKAGLAGRVRRLLKRQRAAT